jgi:YidC/Oxa1 family membrane protein insertase
MYSIFYNLFYQPILNALGVLIILLPGQSFGGAIIILTVVINLLLLPLTHKMKKSQQKITEIQPHIDRIKKEFKDKKEEQAKRTLELYKQHGINPFSGFLLLLVQIPLFIALFKVLQTSSESFKADLYTFLPDIPSFDPSFLGFIDLSEPSILLAIIAALLQFIQGTLMLPPTTPNQKSQTDFGSIMQKQMRYVMPVIVLVFGIRFPAALALYWTTLSLFAIVHEGFVRYLAQRSESKYAESSQQIQ